MTNNTFIRSLHDVGIAAWFGGSLMGAVGLNGGSSEAKDRTDRASIASAGWAKWAPVNAVAIAAHGIGGVGLILSNKSRLAGQAGVGATTTVKSLLTIAAVGSTVYSGIVGKRIADLAPEPTKGATEPTPITSPELASAQRQEKMLQWVTPVLTGAVIVLAAKMGEQQRASSVVAGVAHRARKRANIV